MVNRELVTISSRFCSMEIMHCHDVMLHIGTRASCTCYVDSWHVQNDIDARLSGINRSFAALTLHMGIDTSRECLRVWCRT